jgi:predicted HTH transcriptional regulator
MNIRNAIERPINGIDCAIIQLLQKDGRITNIEIARNLKMSEATVRASMKRLIDNEIIMQKISPIEGVLDTETNLIMKFIKGRCDWGAALK